MYSKKQLFKFLFVLLIKLAGIIQLQAQTNLPEYQLTEISPITIWHGRSANFKVKMPTSATGQATFTMKSDPTPKGEITLNSATGEFKYTPSPDDKFPFRVTFTGTIQGVAPVSQTVLITPIAPIKSEYGYIATKKVVPDPASTDFISVTKKDSFNAEKFNTEQRKTSVYEISGKTIIIDAKKDDNRIFARLNNDPNTRANAGIKELNIYAETVIIRSRLRVPQTNVKIFARELKFEDNDGEPAGIETTPLDYLPTDTLDAKVGDKQGGNGSQGEIAGSFTLNIVKLTVPNNTTKRFIAIGGRGQNPGAGKKGPTGKIVPALPLAGVVMDNGKFDGKAVYAEYRSQYDPEGVKEMPTDGEPGIPAGKPGNGGAGGNIISTVSLDSALVDLKEGQNGNLGIEAEGGEPGSPIPAYWIQVQNPTVDGQTVYFPSKILYEVNVKKGPNTPPLQPDNLPNQDGKISIVPNNPYVGLHPFALRAIILHAKSTYLNGNLEETKNILQPYADILNSELPKPSDFEIEFEQSRNEINSMLSRIASNLDYFGNPAGWVPLLSLETNLKAFDNEIDSAINTLYLAHLVQRKIERQEKDINSITASIANLNKEVDSDAASFTEIQRLIPTLESRAESLKRKIVTVQNSIATRERQLLNRANEDARLRNRVPDWQIGLRFLSTACKVIPVYQPILGGIGAGLDIIQNFDSSKPLDQIQNVRDLAQVFTNDNFEKARQDFDEQVEKLKKRNYADNKEYLKALIAAGKKYAPAVKSLIDLNGQNQVPQDEVEAELKKIKARDPELNDLVAQVTDIMAEQEAFARALAQQQQLAAQISNRITSNLLTARALNDDLNSKLATFDQGTSVYVKEMERNAKDRLLRYQYYFAKAYEYRMLRPYPGQFNLNAVTDKITTFLSDGGTLSAENFKVIKAVYVDEIRQIISRGIQQLQENPPERSIELKFGLTEQELSDLNGPRGQVTIDLNEKIKGIENEENRRIATLAVAQDSTTSGSRPQITVAVPTGEAPPTARLRLVFEHAGDSFMIADGDIFRFRFGSATNDRPFTWGAAYDVKDRSLQPETFSVAGLRLLDSLLNIPATEVTRREAFAQFVRPAADSKLTIKRFKFPSGLRADIRELRLAVQVDFFRGVSQNVWLNIESPSELSPYILNNQKDLLDRQDGRGDFRRLYRRGQTLTLTAQPFFDKQKFARWVDESGNTISNSNLITITLDESLTVKPVYIPMSSTPILR